VALIILAVTSYMDFKVLFAANGSDVIADVVVHCSSHYLE
jgi:hypothetical protein